MLAQKNSPFMWHFVGHQFYEIDPKLSNMILNAATS